MVDPGGIVGLQRVALRGLGVALTITYTLLTTFAAALVGLGLYVLVAPGNLPADVIAQSAAATDAYQPETLYGHILNVIPNNAVRPFFEGNVLSILFVAAAVGLGLAAMPASEKAARRATSWRARTPRGSGSSLYCFRIFSIHRKTSL